MKLSSLLLSALIVVPLGYAVSTRSDAADGTPAAVMGTTRDQAGAAQLVYGLLSDSRYAYRPRPLDATLAADVLKHYLDTLDPNRMFFTAADVAAFEAMKPQIATAIQGGDMAPAYRIFAVYRDRVKQRVAGARALLKQPGVFTFTGNDTYAFDRSKAPWADAKALDGLWRQSVRNDWLRLQLAGRTPAQIQATLDKRYAEIDTGVGQIKGEDVFSSFLNAYTNSVDPHTDYFTPRTAENFNMQMSLSLEGIGAVLQRQDDTVVIREVVPGGPAGEDGRLKPGDRVVAVGQGKSGEMQDVVGWRIDDVVQLIRGPKDSAVRLDVIPASASLDSKPVRIVLVRQKVKLEEQAAKGEVETIPGRPGQPAMKIGVIKLPGFYQDFEGRRRDDPNYTSASRDVAKLLAGFRQQKVDGVVVDLRGNGGGSLDEAVAMTGLFIDRGPVVQVRETGGRVRVYRDDDAGVAWGGPLAVLINRGSASASEIFAGAIKDYGRGLIIGEDSFGKGTVQNMVDLDRWPANEQPRFGEVKLTIAQFFRPDGSSTQNKGVQPDIAFPMTVDATQFGESTYDNALPWTRIAASPHVRYGNFTPILPKLEALHAARAKSDVEFRWWAEDVARFRAERERNAVVLNLAQRKAERDADTARNHARDAERKRLGLTADPLAGDRNDDGLQADERDVARDVAREKAAEDAPDPLLQEAATILADAVRLLSASRPLSAQVLPATHDAQRWAD